MRSGINTTRRRGPTCKIYIFSRFLGLRGGLDELLQALVVDIERSPLGNLVAGQAATCHQLVARKVKSENETTGPYFLPNFMLSRSVYLSDRGLFCDGVDHGRMWQVVRKGEYAAVEFVAARLSRARNTRPRSASCAALAQETRKPESSDPEIKSVGSPEFKRGAVTRSRTTGRCRPGGYTR